MLLFSCQPEPSLEKERALRNKAEEEAVAAQREKTEARMEAAYAKGLAVSGAVVALIMGTALGSRARKDSYSPMKEVNDSDEKPKTKSSSRSP